MSVRALLSVATVLSTMLATAARADETLRFGQFGDDSEPLVLTPAAAVELALAGNPELRSLREIVSEAAGRSVQARSLALPQITGELSTNRSRDPGLLNSPNFEQLGSTPGFDASFLQPVPITSYDYSIRVEQPVYSFGKLRVGIEALGYERQAALDRARAGALETARDVTIACYDAAFADERIDVIETEKRSRERQVAQARDFLEIGAGTKLQLLQAEAGLANVEPRLLAARGDQQQTRARLNRLLGRTPVASVRVAPGLLDAARMSTLPDETGLLASVREWPELVAISNEILSLEKQQQVVRADRLPSLRFDGTFGIRTISTENLLDGDFSSWSAGLFIEWPIYDGSKRRGQMDELLSQKRQAELQLQARYNELAEQLVGSVSDYRSARGAADAAGAATDRAEEAHRVAQEEFRFGTATTLDILEAERTLTEARLQRLRATRDALAALARIETLAGRSPVQLSSSGDVK